MKIPGTWPGSSFMEYHYDMIRIVSIFFMISLHVLNKIVTSGEYLIVMDVDETCRARFRAPFQKGAFINDREIDIRSIFFPNSDRSRSHIFYDKSSDHVIPLSFHKGKP